ncbi:plasmid mobilization protein [Dasania marina]|uniref:plasmid mobilization protein n=1 Tax=Dasania marina TaxID=471499 RepID=UPI00037F9847|nr:plasmid mobilization relaxosome protein MobC [Dasania marina]
MKMVNKNSLHRKCVKKLERIEIRVSDLEKEAIKTKADLLNLAVSQYIRTTVLISTVIERPSRISREYRNQLSAIGNNINQLARAANSGNYVPARELESLRQAVLALVNKQP